MNKLKAFFEKWGGVITLSIFIILLLFGVAACIYTLVVNMAVGIPALTGVVLALGCVVSALVSEVKEIRKDNL